MLNRSLSFSDLPPEQVAQLLNLQRDILEAVALGEHQETVLDGICLSAEAIVPNSTASIMLYDETRTMLNVQSAPSLPEEAKLQLNGLVPASDSGSCGTAVFEKKPVFVTDTKTDPRWCGFGQYIQDFNVGACWSMPIRGDTGEVIGSFALSSFEERHPSKFQVHVMETSSSLAALAFKRQREERALHHAAYHDPLTNLPNRNLFMLQFEHAIDRAVREESRLALLFIDLDHFKDINDTRGHDTGDEVLRKISLCLLDHARKSDLLARFGGDEFVMLIEDVQDDPHVQHVAEKLLDILANPVVVNERHYTLTASIGISLYPKDGTTRHELLQRADTAMYEAKSKGRSRYWFYESALSALIDSRVKMEAELRKALMADEFVLHYQPVFRSSDMKLDTIEVLVRWQHPNRGLVPPAEFIPVAENTGLIIPLGTWILESACRQCVRWWNAGLPLFRLAVNISPKQLDGACSILVEQVLKETSFPASSLEIEVTESMVMDVHGTAIEELIKIKNMGVCIAMDDFGTGYSSLSQLKHLPISKLKIDRSFVSEIPDDPNDTVIAKTIIAMGHALGLEVVGEGVETNEQKEFLIGEECDLLQGFLCSRPLSKDKLEKFISAP